MSDFLEVLQAEFAAAADEIDDALAAWAEAPGQPAAGGRDRAIEQLERLATVARLVGMDEQAHAAGQLLSAALRCPAAADAHGAAVLRWLSSWRLPLTALFERPGEAEAAARWADYLAEEPRPATAEALPQPAADSPAQAEQHSVQDSVPDTAPDSAQVSASGLASEIEPGPVQASAPAAAAPTTPGEEPKATAAADTPRACGPGRLRLDRALLDPLIAGAALQRQGHEQLGQQLKRLEEQVRQLLAAQDRVECDLAELRQQLDVPPSADAALQAQALRADEAAQQARTQAQAASRQMGELDAALAELRWQQQQHHAQLLRARFQPLQRIANRLQRVVQQAARQGGKSVHLQWRGAHIPVDQEVLDRLVEPLQLLLRDAVEHGIEIPELRLLRGKPAQACLTLSATQHAGVLRLECRDDGSGLDRDAIAGRGFGLDRVATHLRALHGRLHIDSEPGAGCCVTLELPLSAAALPVLMLRAGRHRLALPAHRVIELLPPQGQTLEAGSLKRGNRQWPHRRLGPLLGLEDSAAPRAARGVVIAKVGAHEWALGVDEVLGSGTASLSPLSGPLAAVPGLAGGWCDPDGQLVWLLDLDALGAAIPPETPKAQRSPEATAQAAPPGGHDRSADPAAEAHRSHSMAASATPTPAPADNPPPAEAPRWRARRCRLMVVDDSPTVRRVLTRTLAKAGWEIVTASDGREALQRLAEEPVDLVITDLEMPRLDGLELARELRRTPASAELPLLMLTSRDSDRHRQLAQDAGVDRFLTKPMADAELVSAVAQALHGEPTAGLSQPAGSLYS
ncbi:MAG: response regulator [Rubrivivax sp.]|nr:response regulator [Rubrivivax sp.]